MGWAGSILAANQTIRNNRAMLKKRRTKRKLSLISGVNENWVDPKSASVDQLMEIRSRLRREHSLRMRKVVVLALAGLISLGVLLSVIPWEFIFTYTN